MPDCLHQEVHDFDDKQDGDEPGRIVVKKLIAMQKRRKTKTSEAQTKSYNMTFGLLSGLAIIMVVAGHLGYDIMAVGGLRKNRKERECMLSIVRMEYSVN